MSKLWDIGGRTKRKKERYIYKEGWSKYIYSFIILYGSSPVDHKVIVFHGQYIHFDGMGMYIIIQNHVHTFLLKYGNSINYQLNYNRPKSNLEDLYIISKSNWHLKHTNIKLSQVHMKSIIIKYWDGFKVSLALAPWVATTAAWPVPAPVARGPTRTAQPLLLALGRYRTQKIRVME